MSGELSDLFLPMVAFSNTAIFEAESSVVRDMLLILFYLNNTKLEVGKYFKYLGVYFFEDGNWYRTQKCIADHASYALHSLFSVFNDVELPTFQKMQIVRYSCCFCPKLWLRYLGILRR